MILFRCSTYYQLINAINIKINVLGDGIEADIIINKSTDFSHIVKRLEESKIFRKIIYMDDSVDDNRIIRELNNKDKEIAVLNPEKYIPIDFFNDTTYTDYYIPVDDEFAKLIYYLLIKKGDNIRVHIFDESKSTYVLNVKKRAETDGMSSVKYGEKNFLNCIDEILLYEPELYMGVDLGCVITQIPKIDREMLDIKNIYNFIFGTEILPEEKYIFFESPFYHDKFMISEMDTIELFSEIVGIENIAVKLHPRNNIDRFSQRGFKVLENSLIPWELFLLNYSFQNKVLVTISSNAITTGDMLYNMPVFGIQMFKLLEVGKNAGILGLYKKLDEELLKKYNKEKLHLFTPRNWEELREEIKYINGRMENEQ